MSGEAVWWVFAAFSLVWGLVIGSFLNVVILRMPEDRSLIPGSACPSCRTPVAPYDNVPVLSWLALRGRCRHCGAPISPQYPLIEALTGSLAFLAFVRFVPSVFEIDPAHGAAWLVYSSFLSILVVVSYVDLRHHIILDETSIYAVIPAILGVAGMNALGYTGWLDLGWRESVLGALLGGGAMAAVYFAVRFVLRTEGLGWGDVKLMAMMGAFLGPIPGLFLAVLMGSVLGSVVGLLKMVLTGQRGMLPMGPPLAVGAALYVLYGDLIRARVFPGIGAWEELMIWLLSG
ncbi:MAG: prepilin peptidase [Deltaproteobacteria bacterium]|nr:prepilin peptidase [Deltaproteobacteria bacterium]